MKTEELLSKMKESIIEGQKDEAQRLAKDAILKNIDLNEMIEKGYVPGIKEVGNLWEKGDYFLPELISSAECMETAMNTLQPELEKGYINTKTIGKVIIGTVHGDIHDIGKNLVSSMLSAYGIEVIDLGTDVKLETFIERAVAEKADLICLSALLTTTMLGQKKIIEMLKDRELYGRCKVLVGGAPVNQKWSEEIGADGYAANAISAVKIARSFIE